MNKEHEQRTPGERALPLAKVVERVGRELRAAGIHPYFVVVPGEAPGEHHVAVCLDAYAAAACLRGARAAAGNAPATDTSA